LKPLPLNEKRKLTGHIKLLFNTDISDKFPIVQCEYSKRTGRIKNFSIDSELFATLRKDGQLVLTLFGARKMMRFEEFKQNCIIPKEEAIPFISEGRSLFCKHVKWCGNNIKIGSEVVVIDNDEKVLAVGRSICSSILMDKFNYGVAVKIREGIKSRK
jgi:uncharacterized protein with predicted RNA binding PUA domain